MEELLLAAGLVYDLSEESLEKIREEIISEGDPEFLEVHDMIVDLATYVKNMTGYEAADEEMAKLLLDRHFEGFLQECNEKYDGSLEKYWLGMQEPDEFNS